MKKDAEREPILSDAYAIIPSGYKKMIDLAANLFNSSSNDFNLMDALSTWDDRLVKLYYQALSIRMEGNTKIDGLTF